MQEKVARWKIESVAHKLHHKGARTKDIGLVLPLISKTTEIGHFFFVNCSWCRFLIRVESMTCCRKITRVEAPRTVCGGVITSVCIGQKARSNPRYRTDHLYPKSLSYLLRWYHSALWFVTECDCMQICLINWQLYYNSKALVKKSCNSNSCKKIETLYRSFHF